MKFKFYICHKARKESTETNLILFFSMPAPAAEPAVPKTELQELQLKATEKTDEVCEVDSL